jgi:hypothetical protein
LSLFLSHSFGRRRERRNKPVRGPVRNQVKMKIL